MFSRGTSSYYYALVMRAHYFPSLIVLMFALAPVALFAHSTGVSLEKQVGDAVIDVAYEPIQPLSGDRLLFDFNLLQPVASTSIAFDYVWVRLEHEKKTLLATGIARADFGPTSLLYTLPDISGDIQLHVRYQKAGNPLAETSFLIPIQSRPKPWFEAENTVIFGAFLSGLIIGAMCLFAANRRKKRVV